MPRLGQALRFGTALGLVLLLVGCEPIQSVHPFWTAETLVAEPRLLGTWVNRESPNESDTTLRLERPKPGSLSYAHFSHLYDVYLYCQRPVGEDKTRRG